MSSKSIPGYEGRYEIDEAGNITSLRSGRRRKWCIGDRGYAYVALHADGEAKMFKVHRLVATVFVSGTGPQINHRDGNKLNNHFTNLEWCTPSENIQHAYATGLARSRRGVKSNLARLTDAAAAEIRFLIGEGFQQKDIAEAFGVAKSTVTRVKQGSIWAGNDEAHA